LFLILPLGKLLHSGKISKMIASYIGGNKHFESLYLKGEIGLELVPQGTLVERIRAHAAGIPAFFTPTAASTAVEEGTIPIQYNPGGMPNGVKIPGNKKESRDFGGRRFVLEPAIAGDVAIIRAWKVDEVGNCVFRSDRQFLVKRPSFDAIQISDSHRITSVHPWQRTPS
jgi:3-oxoacid CoA-transferase